MMDVPNRMRRVFNAAAPKTTSASTDVGPLLSHAHCTPASSASTMRSIQVRASLLLWAATPICRFFTGSSSSGAVFRAIKCVASRQDTRRAMCHSRFSDAGLPGEHRMRYVYRTFLPVVA